MDKEVKKKLARNWFSILQQIICKDIEEIEKKNGKRQKASTCGRQVLTYYERENSGGNGSIMKRLRKVKVDNSVEKGKDGKKVKGE